MKFKRFALYVLVLITCIGLLFNIAKANDTKELPKDLEVTYTAKVRASEISNLVFKIVNRNGYTIKDVSLEISGVDSDSIEPFLRIQYTPAILPVSEMVSDKKSVSPHYPLEVPENTSLGSYQLRWTVRYNDLYGEEQSISDTFFVEVSRPNVVIGTFRIVLDQFSDWFGNYGWAVLFLALLIKVLMYPLSISSMKSQAQIQAIQPRITEINKLYKDNQQKKSEEIMKLYKEEKINPASGCLPLLPQFVVLYLLYGALQGYTPLFQSSFLWVQSLGQPDPYYIFPILAGVSTFFQSLSSGQAKDPQAKTMTYMMPVIFFIIMMRFPAALSIFWTAFGVFSWVQQYIFNKNNKSKTGANITIVPKSK